jgi:hypothetical protein
LMRYMAKPSQDDPTKDPEFPKMVQTFLKTPPKPHKAAGKRKSSAKRKRPEKAK